MTSQKRILRWRKGAPIQQAMDRVAIEEPLEIQVETRPVSVTMRTPGHDPELVAGFLLSEGMIHQADDIREIRPYPRNRDGNSLGVFLKPGVPFDFSKLTRHVFASSSCGLCGKASIQAVHAHFKPVRSRFQVDPVLLAGLPNAMHQVQETFQSTGGLHAAGLFDITGKLLLCREDVGRHNAVDKVLGHALLARWLPLNRHILLVSGRASFEILQKALSAQVSILCAVGAPSSLAVDFARASGQTLIGFLREGRFNAYAGTHRIRRIQPS
jgi:FdhD protein